MEPAGNRANLAADGAPEQPPVADGRMDGPMQAPDIREQDRYMPIANVIRIMRKVLPSHAKISDEAKETMQECVSEYISFITGEANDRCRREKRKTVTAEDILWAMNRLGFDDYVEPLQTYLARYRALEGDHVRNDTRSRGGYFPSPSWDGFDGASPSGSASDHGYDQFYHM